MHLVTFIAVALVASVVADLDDSQKQFRDGSLQFTSKMFSEVVKHNPDKSVVVSAFSVLPPLAQLSLAAVGESHDELLNAIGLRNDNVTRTEIPAALSRLRSVRGVELKLTNKMYVALDSQLQDPFVTASTHTFDSKIQNIDFTKSQETANAINNWVEEETNHHIKNLVDPDNLDSSTRAILVNAIYFKGNWKNKFNKNSTNDRDFHVSDEKIVKVPTMHIHTKFKYAFSSDLKAELLEIPYEGDEVVFLIILPRKVEGLAAVHRQIKENQSLLDNAVTRMHEITLDVYLPKFKIETETNLKEVLPKIGVTKIFNPQTARLDNMLKSGESIYISGAKQKAYIEINEEGAEAAASNAFGINLMSLPPQFKANRPFLFALKVKDGPLLFTGVFRG